MHKYTIPITIGVCDTAKLLHEDNGIIITTSNWMVWWILNICFCA